MEINTFKVQLKKIFVIIISFSIVGLVCGLLADSLKILTEHYEHILFEKINENHWLVFVFPLIGLSTIKILRKYLFKNKQNKGIKEVLKRIREEEKYLPSYKVPSHYFNGFLTVVFGGSTGIEVSTVVSTATVGSLASSKSKSLVKYKNELICAGLASGITALFNAPLAGIFFAYEVFSKKINKAYILGIIPAVGMAYLVNRVLSERSIFDFQVSTWNDFAWPYFILLGILAGLCSVYLTKSVLTFKSLFSFIKNDVNKVFIGSLAISLLIFFLPSLYGQGYIAIHEYGFNINSLEQESLLPIVLIILAKPIITSITLGAGGDGGVFAPSIFIGTFLGIALSLLLTSYFGVEIIPTNFMVIGMAAVLSGSIHAPLTSTFLICSVVGNYNLFIPILAVSFISKLVANFILPYTVYTLKTEEQKAFT